MGNGISWLHLTDLHCGSQGFAESWGSVSSRMKDDLRGLIKEKLGGELDLVLFTGDLTQSATPDQFKRLNGFLDELWGWFKAEGCSPKLFAVPGNHDLVRPSSIDRRRDAYLLLKKTWADDDHQQTFWSSKGGRINSLSRKFVHKAFANYAAWWDAVDSNRKLASHAGALPGDHSASFMKDGIKLGLVGLNSAFLQLTDGIEETAGALDVRPAQLHAACGDQGAANWIDQHHVCFLLTHHPATWLADGGSNFVKEVCEGPDRFALHLFGHMHEQRAAELSIQGGQPRRTIQGASLFSQERWGHGATRRTRLIAGYSAGRLVKQGTGYAYSLFPRAQQEVGGGFRMLRDPSFEYDSATHEGTSWRRIKARQLGSGEGANLLVSSFAESFRGVAALAGPPRYAQVHKFLEEWFEKHGQRVGPIRVKNIAFDMQHTFLCLRAISGSRWAADIEWRTVFLDHRQSRLQEDLKKDDEITLVMAGENEQRLVALLRKERDDLAKKRIVIDARAYDEIPVMHGFLVNDSALIVGVCMRDNASVKTSPYMVFLVDGEDTHADPDTARDMRDMFSRWFDAHWASGRPIQPDPDPSESSKAPS
ncbi:metallophosphoesterase family protein [Sphaerotilaceae bacterium SBD11-9]